MNLANTSKYVQGAVSDALGYETGKVSGSAGGRPAVHLTSSGHEARGRARDARRKGTSRMQQFHGYHMLMLAGTKRQHSSSEVECSRLD